MTDLNTTLLQTISNQLTQLIQVSTPESPNYRRSLAEYPAFIWQDISAIVVQKDDHGATEVEWHGHRFLRRSGDGKFGDAIWFSRPIGQGENGAEYARLITFKDFEPEPLAKIELPAPAEAPPQPEPAPPASEPAPQPVPEPDRPYSAQIVREKCRDFVLLCEEKRWFHDPETGEALPIDMGPFGNQTPEFLARRWKEALASALQLEDLKDPKITNAYNISLKYIYFNITSANDLSLAQVWPILFILFNSLALDIVQTLLSPSRTAEEKAKDMARLTWHIPITAMGEKELLNVYEAALAEETEEIPF